MVLTKRDKTLLQFLAIAVILVAFGSLLIFPQWNKMGKLSDRVAEKKLEQKEVQMSIQQIPLLQQQIKDNQTTYETAVKDFYPMMESHEIERMITKMILDQGLSSYDLEVSSRPARSTMLPYFASAQAVAMGLSEEQITQAQQSQTDVQQDTTTEDAKDGQKILYSSRVHVTVVGNRDNMKKLIDTLYDSHPSIRITGYSVDSETVMNRETQTTADLSTLNLGLELYMCAK
ncbi:MAG: hypothetical protein RR869_00295 [Lachnospiraceae bacterium]